MMRSTVLIWVFAIAVCAAGLSVAGSRYYAAILRHESARARLIEAQAGRIRLFSILRDAISKRLFIVSVVPRTIISASAMGTSTVLPVARMVVAVDEIVCGAVNNTITPRADEHASRVRPIHAATLS